jgi:2-phosphosulfolactate phosphatase
MVLIRWPRYDEAIPRRGDQTMPSIHAYFLPQMTTPDALEGATVVVIDILRATTTITYAVAAGATRVIPCGEIDEAKLVAADLARPDRPRPLLGGERGGLPIPDFDLGNSPAEFTPDHVGGRTVVFTTTNGTRAMLHCRQAKRVLLGSFVNLRAVIEQLRDTEDVHLVCAGTNGEITREDVLAAGAIAHGLMMPDDPVAAGDWSRCVLNDAARIARDAWQATLPPAEILPSSAPPRWLAQALADSVVGRNLQRIGLARDIGDCAVLDRFDVVGELDVEAWEVRRV